MTVSCTMLLIWVRHLPEDALLLMIRQAFGLEAREGETDVLASFHEVATSVQDKLDGYERMRLQVDHAVTNMGKVALVGRKLAENISGNHHSDLEDPTRREGLVDHLAGVCFEFLEQMKRDEPTPTSPGSRKAAMVGELTNLVRELKTWSEEAQEDECYRRSSTSPGRRPSTSPRLALRYDGAGSGAPPRPRASAFTPIDDSVAGAIGRTMAPLPPGWREQYDKGSGRSFYYHRHHRVPQWNHPLPEEEDSPPPSPPPARTPPLTLPPPPRRYSPPLAPSRPPKTAAVPPPPLRLLGTPLLPGQGPRRGAS